MNATKLQVGQKVILTTGFGSTVATVLGHEILRFGHHVELVTEDGDRETISGEATEHGIGWRVAPLSPAAAALMAQFDLAIEAIKGS